MKVLKVKVTFRELLPDLGVSLGEGRLPIMVRFFNHAKNSGIFSKALERSDGES